MSKAVAKGVLPPPKDEVESTSSSYEAEIDEEGNLSPPEKGKEIPTATLDLKPKQTEEQRKVPALKSSKVPKWSPPKEADEIEVIRYFTEEKKQDASICSFVTFLQQLQPSRGKRRNGKASKRL